MRFGILGEFRDAERLVAAVRLLRARGYRRMDAFTPFPIEGLQQELAIDRSPLDSLAGPIGGFGAVFAFFLQWLLVAHLYPLNDGGRPAFSIPAFIIITFETMVLFTSVAVFVLFFWVCRLPRLSHPLFAVPGFDSATLDGFWLGVNVKDEMFDPDRTERELRDLGAARVEYVGESA
ncbi:MAG TPA: DUF3341 domain-containing protein [Polyangia bacterium]|nr:DUF3341 domain-containing protein [Polyangia bacterium]